MIDYEKRIAALSPEKRALLERRLRKEGRVFNSFPLSYAQQRLWFNDQLEPGNIAYNMPTTVRYQGPFNVSALVSALTEIVRRHETLRTTFAAVDGQPVQIIGPALPFKLPLIDLSASASDERESLARKLTIEEAQRPFDLTRGPLLRATLLRLGPEDHLVLLTIHHIISDGWSMSILMKELSALYGAFAEGRPSPLPELPIQYADYAQWQRKWLEGELWEAQLSYWKKQLRGAQASPSLQTDKPRPARQSYRAAKRILHFPEALSKALKTLSQREDATLFITLLAGFKALLYRYTGEGDILIGSPIAGRHRLETEGLIGFFVNMLVLRTHLEDNPTFLELLRRVRQTTLEAYAHQDMPFDKLVDVLQIERQPNRHALVQILFTLQNQTPDSSGLPSAGQQLDAASETSTDFDLILEIVDTGQRLSAGLVYSLDLFEEATITRFLDHYRMLLEEVVVNFEQRLTEIPLETDAQSQQREDASRLHARLETEEFDF